MVDVRVVTLGLGCQVSIANDPSFREWGFIHSSYHRGKWRKTNETRRYRMNYLEWTVTAAKTRLREQNTSAKKNLQG